MKAAKGGFYYEINRDHPMVEQIRSNPESVSKLLESMLHLIESSLPLNQLYIDLNLNPQNSICCYDRYLPNYSQKIS
jgi:hypothetical protein